MLSTKASPVSTYWQAIEIVLAGGSICSRDYPHLPRVDESPHAGASIIANAAALAAWLDDQTDAWEAAADVIEVAIDKITYRSLRFPKPVKLGLRGLAMQADFAAGLMKVGGLT